MRLLWRNPARYFRGRPSVSIEWGKPSYAFLNSPCGGLSPKGARSSFSFSWLRWTPHAQAHLLQLTATKSFTRIPTIRARPGTVVLEMSTISPKTSRELHRLGARGGIEVPRQKLPHVRYRRFGPIHRCSGRREVRLVPMISSWCQLRPFGCCLFSSCSPMIVAASCTGA